MTQQTPPPISPYTPPGTEAPQAPSDATGGIIPYKNAPALVGYYLGVFSLIPVLGLLLGPAAFILGIIGFRAYKKEPRKRGHIHAWVAIILGLLTTFANAGLIILPFIA